MNWNTSLVDVVALVVLAARVGITVSARYPKYNPKHSAIYFNILSSVRGLSQIDVQLIPDLYHVIQLSLR